MPTISDYIAKFFEDTPLDGILGLGFKEIAVLKVPPVFDMMVEEGLVRIPFISSFFAFCSCLTCSVMQVQQKLFSVYLSNVEGGDGSFVLFGETDPKACLASGICAGVWLTAGGRCTVLHR
jgi:hypothetical protein